MSMFFYNCKSRRGSSTAKKVQRLSKVIALSISPLRCGSSPGKESRVACTVHCHWPLHSSFSRRHVQILPRSKCLRYRTLVGGSCAWWQICPPNLHFESDDPLKSGLSRDFVWIGIMTCVNRPRLSCTDCLISDAEPAGLYSIFSPLMSPSGISTLVCALFSHHPRPDIKLLDPAHGVRSGFYYNINSQAMRWSRNALPHQPPSSNWIR
jgi:hypothetical protein